MFNREGTQPFQPNQDKACSERCIRQCHQSSMLSIPPRKLPMANLNEEAHGSTIQPTIAYELRSYHNFHISHQNKPIIKNKKASYVSKASCTKEIKFSYHQHPQNKLHLGCHVPHFCSHFFLVGYSCFCFITVSFKN